MDDPGKNNCYLTQSSLVLEQVHAMAGNIVMRMNEQPLPVVERNLIFPPQSEFPRDASDYMLWKIQFNDESIHWSGYTVNGAIVIQQMNRPFASSIEVVPYMSDLSLALYKRHVNSQAPPRFIYFAVVVNEQAYRLVTEALYTSWTDTQPTAGELRAWEYGTQEFEEILGTRIGQVAVFIVLTASPIPRDESQIPYRIARIQTHRQGESLYMRFDIEPFTAN